MVYSPQMLGKVVLAGEALLTDAVAAFKGTVEFGALRCGEVGFVMAFER